MKVHSFLGPGLLESVYQQCLAYELQRRGLRVAVQVPLPITYGALSIKSAYRIDMLVNEIIVVELKAVAALLPVHEAQLLSYLRLSRNRVGLMINFHVVHLKDGIRR